MTGILRQNQDNVYLCKGTSYYIGGRPCAATPSAINNTSTHTSNSPPCCTVGQIHVVDHSSLNCHAPIVAMVTTIMWRMGDGWATFISRACILMVSELNYSGFYKFNGHILWSDSAENPLHHLEKWSWPNSDHRLEELSHMKSDGVDTWFWHWLKPQKKKEWPLLLKDTADKAAKRWSPEVMEFNDDIDPSVHVPKWSRSDGKVCGHIHKM